MGNHDQKRIASRYGTDRVDAINLILSTLPGVSITYNVSILIQ
jgi:alpha-glucosidase